MQGSYHFGKIVDRREPPVLGLIYGAIAASSEFFHFSFIQSSHWFGKVRFTSNVHMSHDVCEVGIIDDLVIDLDKLFEILN